MILICLSYNDSRKGLVNNISNEIAFTLNDVALFSMPASAIGHVPPAPFPFWHPEGTYTMKLYYGSTGSAFSLAGTISVIEFNVRK